jgi:ribonuclease III
MNEEEVEARIGHVFQDRRLLQVALTHRSAVAQSGANNEKLEFLGDAVLDLAISDLLMMRWPDANEGLLSRRRAALVNARSLAGKAALLELGPALDLGKGEQRSGGGEKASILAAAFEALLGAIYKDGGFLTVLEVVKAQFAAELAMVPDNSADYKTRLQELTQKHFREVPRYSVIRSSGPDHDKAFVSEIEITGRHPSRGEGKSKKAAEQDAARRALSELVQEIPSD